ncbi:hypothetical protein P691DRAFT_323741 [Macrolepiota fuliginosa MF-IS2]|uniref:Uncharacterized protein n=1 Tax=Macrolepiota fuliginosa MF-IS2 TaxID=1400762 RepID=A0A9P6C0L4_9AGAR|nr:hypothetical protein P691DRAFT_323741 [Macrolepiota fuliginosa MF-IS2]
MNPFQVISLSGVKTTTTFARLGIEILDNYPINKILKIAQSGSSSSFNKCHDYHFPIRTEHVIQLNDALEEKRECYFGESEHVSRVMIDTYFDALANHLPAIARLEFCLARITAKLEAIEVDRTDGATVHRTFLTGEVDYALLSIIHYEDGLPNCRLGNKRQRRNLLRELELKSFRGTYQGLAGYLLQAMKGNTPNLDWDILFIEAKRRSWFLPTGTVSPASLYQAIATCRAAYVTRVYPW